MKLLFKRIPLPDEIEGKERIYQSDLIVIYTRFMSSLVGNSPGRPHQIKEISQKEENLSKNQGHLLLYWRLATDACENMLRVCS